ncbi:hypothetical protein [Streptomyces sp. HPF1205]|uniref:hypothetical protein n=1 Tax=Streptomyces sp. HPF1205 TaxID=2873262 RepID=UPI001CEC12A9|nr:hypothetical protein [Streptomyces sp. HPF1205]
MPAPPEQPDVRITRLEFGSVEAWGGDALAGALLERAGFITEWHFHRRYHRLPWDQGRQRENQQATHAAQMLTLAGYRVDLDPSLATHPVQPADPDGTYRLGDHLRDMTAAMTGAETYHAAADLTDQIVNDVHGLLPHLAQFLHAAHQQALAAGTQPARHLAADFKEAASQITGIARHLTHADQHFRLLGPTVPDAARPVPGTGLRHEQPTAEAHGTIAPPPTTTERPRSR